VITAPRTPPSCTMKFLNCLTPRRLRAQTIVLALCLWGICAVDLGTPGLFDRAGNIKFQDFLPFYISARLIAQHRASDIYNQAVQRQELQSIVGQTTRVEIPYLYGPQVALFFNPLDRLSFADAARIWAGLTLVLYGVCVYAVWSHCRVLRKNSGITALAAVAFPPLFHVFMRGHISVLILLCFTAAVREFRSDRSFVAGLALGLLVFKPQFLVGIPLILLFARAWRPLVALMLSAGAQLALTRLYFGSAVMQNYFGLFRHPARWIAVAELSGAPMQMHSLRSFWTLLIPSQTVALTLYALSSVVVIAVAARIWKSDSPLALRFAALTLAAVLVNPHLFIYDLLALAPAILLVVDWVLANRDTSFTPQVLTLSYFAFVLPLFGPLSRWTHLQFSVVAFVGLLWTLFCFATRGHKLASAESLVV
jgi:hypothetical protein